MSGFDILGPTGATKPYGTTPYGAKPYGHENLAGKLVSGGADGTERSEPFFDALNETLSEVRSLQLEARDKSRDLASGKPVEVHDLMISMGKSEVAFNMMLEVRNKLLEAWQTLKRSVS